MEPIYVIQNGLGMQEDSLKIYPDRILIRKPKERKSTKMDVIKKELRLQGIIPSEYIGIDVPFSKIDSIYLRLSTCAFIKNGLIIFYLKDRKKNEVTFLNYERTANAMKFWAEENETAMKIKEYVERRIQ